MSPNTILPAALPFYLKVPEAARELRTGRRNIYKLIRAGKLKAVPINARGDLRICADWIREYLNDNAR